MAKLTSRPVVNNFDVQLKSLTEPVINIITWISSLVTYPDDSHKSIKEAVSILEDALDCLGLLDYSIIATFSPSAYELHYNVSFKALEAAPYTTFKVVFAVRP